MVKPVVDVVTIRSRPLDTCGIASHLTCMNTHSHTREDEQRSAALSFRIRPSLKRDLEELAKADRRPLSNFLEIALEALVESKKQPTGKKR